MYRKIEALGTWLLDRFVPEIEAQACGCNEWPHCWQCGNSPCSIDTCVGEPRCGVSC